MKKKTLLLIGIALVGLFLLGTVGLAAYRALKYAKEEVPAAVDVATIAEAPSTETAAPTEEAAMSGETEIEIKKPLPAELNLHVPFYTQAPFSNWDYPWQEACEEATALLIANVYLQKNWTREQFNQEILKLVEWEKERFGDYKHTTVEQTVEIFNDYLGLETVVHENPSFADIQRIVARGRLIAMPFAGKMLKNPNFKNGGPIYHMLVVKGYKAGEKIITNDVGTRKGEDYVYPWSIAGEALHDYAEPIQNGAKRVIEVMPKNVAGSWGCTLFFL